MDCLDMQILNDGETIKMKNEQLKEELFTMFRNKWYSTLNQHIYTMIIEDVMKVIERHNERSN